MLSEREYILKQWAEDGQKVLDTIDQQDIKAMDGDEFLSHCTACGGNWGGMLLSGIKHYYPEVYEAIPASMGRHAWECICTLLVLLKVEFKEC